MSCGCFCLRNICCPSGFSRIPKEIQKTLKGSADRPMLGPPFLNRGHQNESGIRIGLEVRVSLIDLSLREPHISTCMRPSAGHREGCATGDRLARGLRAGQHTPIRTHHQSTRLSAGHHCGRRLHESNAGIRVFLRWKWEHWAIGSLDVTGSQCPGWQRQNPSLPRRSTGTWLQPSGQGRRRESPKPISETESLRPLPLSSSSWPGAGPKQGLRSRSPAKAGTKELSGASGAVRQRLRLLRPFVGVLLLKRYSRSARHARRSVLTEAVFSFHSSEEICILTTSWSSGRCLYPRRLAPSSASCMPGNCKQRSRLPSVT